MFHQEDTDVSEESSDTFGSRSGSVETVVETDDEATDQLSLKLNRLTEKLCRYESHKYFITKCLKDKLIPEGFWNWEPSIGNHDEEFLQEWYDDLTAFLRTRMEKTVRFCDKTITVTKNNINQTEEELKKKTAPSNFKEVKDEITKNKEGYSAQLIQKKDRKYHNLKYRGNRRALKRNTHINSVNTSTPSIQSKSSFSQVVQIPQPSTQSRPPARKETESRTFFKQAQGQENVPLFKDAQLLTLENSHKSQ